MSSSIRQGKTILKYFIFIHKFRHASPLLRPFSIFAHLEQIATEGSEGRIQFQLSALQLEYKMGSLVRTEPNTFFEVSRQTQTSIGNKWVVVYRSNRVVESLKPTWDTADLDLQTFCNGDLDRPILISVYVIKKKGKHCVLGTIETSASILLEKGEKGSARDWHEATFTLRKSGYNSHEEAGHIAVAQAKLIISGEGTRVNDYVKGEGSIDAPCEAIPNAGLDEIETENDQVGGKHTEQTEDESKMTEALDLASLQGDASAIGTTLTFQPNKSIPTFSSYVDSGCEIDLCVAIDFTSSNGEDFRRKCMNDGSFNSPRLKFTKQYSFLNK